STTSRGGAKLMSAGVTVQTRACRAATTTTRAPGVTVVAATRLRARCRSGVGSADTDSERCITTKPLQANTLQIWRNVGNASEPTGRGRSSGEDRTVSGCFGPPRPRREGATDEGRIPAHATAVAIALAMLSWAGLATS